VERLDHERLAVTLAQGALDRSVALDPGKKVEDGEAEAARVTDVAAGRDAIEAPASGPVDNAPRYLAALALGIAALLAFLAVVVTELRLDAGMHYALYAIPVALGLAALAALYRLLRKPCD
jgi:hypothetical protein